MDENAKILALSSMAHRSRLAILQMLVIAGPEGQSAGEISEHLGVVPSSLSFHLKEMLGGALVSARREGTFIYYSARFETIGGVIDFLIETCLTDAERTGV
jgi:ArsR family transcriptional regulator, arsenate/arsenite/antimonite-responsive transcriptional repressor